MQKNDLLKAGILTAILVCISVMAWEISLRNQHKPIAFDDGGSLWSNQRKQVYQPIDKATVFIGSSRIKFDLDIDTWQNITGDNAIQLSNVGSSPLSILADLANDRNFKGKMIIDVTEGLFFATSPQPNVTPLINLAYYKKETPAQKFSFKANYILENNFVFLDKENLSLNALLSRVNIANRPGVFQLPIFPDDFTQTSFERQNFMTPQFLADTSLQTQVKEIWAFLRGVDKSPPLTSAVIDSIISVVNGQCTKIKARGGEIMFVRTPSSGPILLGENMAFPREKFWNKLLAVTNCQGIHFADYPSIAHYQCPEFSHLSPKDAVSFTKNLIDILQQKGWRFQHAGKAVSKI